MQTRWPSSLYYTDFQLSLCQSHRSFFCWKSHFFFLKKQRGKAKHHKTLGLPTPQWYSIDWSFCASWHLTEMHVFSSAIYVNGISALTAWVRCAHASAASTGEAQVQCVDKSISLLCSSPVEATHTHTHSRLVFLSRASVFHHLFFIALILTQLQQMKGIISGLGASRCWFAGLRRQAPCAGFHRLPWKTPFNKT